MAFGIVIASLLLAWATYPFIERPVRFSSNRLRRTHIVAACVAVLGACGLAVWVTVVCRNVFPPASILEKLNAATLDETYAPTNGMNVLEYNSRGYFHGGSNRPRRSQSALAGNSTMFHYGPRLQQLADEGRLAVRAYFVTGPACPLVPGVIASDIYAYCAQRREQIVGVGTKREGANGRSRSSLLAQEKCPHRTGGQVYSSGWGRGREARFLCQPRRLCSRIETERDSLPRARCAAVFYSPKPSTYGHTRCHRDSRRSDSAHMRRGTTPGPIADLPAGGCKRIDTGQRDRVKYRE